MPESAHDFDVVGVGSPLLDVLARVPEAFIAGIRGAKGGMELVDAIEMGALTASFPEEPVRLPGGSAANTLGGLARLGSRCTFLGKIGRDEISDLYCGALGTGGIDLSRLKHCDSTPSGQCLCLITPDSQRTCRTFLGASSLLAPEEVTVADFRGCRLAHVEGYVLFNRDLARHVLATARAAGCEVSLDLASFEVVRANQDILAELLRDYVDIVFANEDEARAFCGSDDPKQALAELGELCATVAVKLGPDGAWLKRGEEVVFAPANRVQAVDTTGAGDLWASGFLYGHLNGRDLAACGRYGALTGAAVVQVIGANISIDNWNLIREQVQ